MSARDILLKAADLIEPAGQFTRLFTAREPNQNGDGDYSCLATNPLAISWGMTGAIFKVGREAGLTDRQCWEIEHTVAKSLGAERCSAWIADPSRSQADAVAALRQAASMAIGGAK